MFWILLAGGICFLLWYYLIKPLNHFKKIGVKQCDPWPLFGDNWKLIAKQISFADLIEHVYKANPNTRYTGFFQFTTPTLVIKDPELIKQITVKDFDHFTDHIGFLVPEAEPLLAGNLFLQKGHKWRELRATLSGSFTSSKMKNMFGLINETAENFVQNFLNDNKDLTEVEMKDILTRLTNDVIATTAFGIKVDSIKDPNNTFYSMGKTVTSFGLFTKIKFFGCMMVPWLFRVFKIAIINKDCSTFFRKVIHETIETREAQGIVRQDMINLLLEARKGIKSDEAEAIETGFATVQEAQHDIGQFKQRKFLSNDDITSQAFIFFLAGFDTVSTAMCYGLYELALNREIQEKLRREIQATHQTDNGKLTYEHLLKMKYLDMVVSEILRKWTPAVSMDRVCTKPYTIEPVMPDEQPVHLKKGDVIGLPYHAIHRCEEFYPNPENFDPDRFSDENKANILPYTYLPFGSGPRNCIGSRFALLEVKTLFFNLLLHFKIVPTKRTPIPLVLEKGTFRHTAENGFWLGLKKIKPRKISHE